MSPVRMGKIEAAIRAAVAFQKARSQRDLDGMLALVSPDCVFESPGPVPRGEVLKGKEAIQTYWQDFFEANPDAQFKSEEAFSAGDRCILRWQVIGLSVGEGDDPLRGVDIFRVKDRLICEIFTYVKSS